MIWRFTLLLLFSLKVVTTASTAQTTASQLQKKATTFQDSLLNLQQLPARYFNKISAKADKLDHRIARRTAKSLHRLQRQEEKINSKLSKIDSVAAKGLILSRSIDSLSHLQAVIKGKISSVTSKIPGKQYIPYLDTLKNTLNFLDKYSDRLDRVKAVQQKVQSSLSSIHQLEGRMQHIRQIQQYINQRKALLNETLSSPAFAKAMAGKYGKVLKKHLGKIGKEVYYYKAQIKNYKELWQQPDKLERKALSLLHKVPAFTDFMKEHSALASLFNITEGASADPEESLQGLQTRAMVQQELQQQIQAGGIDGREGIQQQMSKARQKLRELKDKISGGGSTAEMPDFKPKDLKSRTFGQRLEFGGNVGFSKPARFTSFSGITFPTTSDIAGQVAYKFSEKGSAGIGAAFKLGWGSNIGKIHFTAQGVGVRSFIDYKIKGSIYINGGLEMNYNKTIPRIPELEGLNGWTKSALLGIEKKYKINDKLKGNMMLLFDFLYKQHIPQTQPILFRVGYNL